MTSKDVYEALSFYEQFKKNRASVDSKHWGILIECLENDYVDNYIVTLKSKRHKRIALLFLEGISYRSMIKEKGLTDMIYREFYRVCLGDKRDHGMTWYVYYELKRNSSYSPFCDNISWDGSKRHLPKITSNYCEYCHTALFKIEGEPNAGREER